MNRRVVITGMGTINPLGDNLEDYYNNLIAGKSGIKKFTSIDLSNVECKIGGDLGDYDAMAAVEKFKEDLGDDFKRVKKLIKSTTFSAKMTALASIAAYKDAGLFDVDVDPYKANVIVAGHNLNSNYIYNNGLQFQTEPAWTDPLGGVDAPDPNVAGVTSEVLNLKGPMFTIGGACASGNLALRSGCRDIISGESDISVIAGAPFDVSPTDIHASVFINAVVVKPYYQENPEFASRPFDGERCGFLYSHGAGTLILEELESAKARGAYIYGEVLAVKAGANACHLPLPGAEEQVRVMKEVMRMADVKPEDIDYINCHATGTPKGDLQEILAIKGAFGDHAKNLKLNAPKSMLGHTCWASPIIETIGGLLQMKYGRLHPTINIDTSDPEIDLDICANKPVDHQIKYMLKNSFGFGGVNCVSLIKRFEEN
jgi:3-oxoacyl-(acyl-carrier-protein) synthase